MVKNEVVEVVTRVKGFLINSSNELLVVLSYGGVQLVGGHVEDGEDLDKAMIRELREETGIEIDDRDEYKAFFEIKHPYSKSLGNGRRREARIVYYWIRTDKKPDADNMELTDREIENNLRLQYVSVADFEAMCKDTMINNDKEVNRIIAREMLTAFGELKKTWG